MALKAVFFDIDNTLFPTDEFAEFARRKALRAMAARGLRFNESKTFPALMRIVKAHGANNPRHFDLLLERLGVERDPKLIAAAVIAYHKAKDSLKPYPDTKPTLRLLRKKRYRIYALSRGVDVKQWDKLMCLGLDRVFKGVFVTGKKDLHFYSGVLRNLRLSRGEAAMVGDNPKIDIIPARKAGIITIHLAKGKHAKDADRRHAHFSISSLRELPKLISKISGDSPD